MLFVILALADSSGSPFGQIGAMIEALMIE